MVGLEAVQTDSGTVDAGLEQGIEAAAVQKHAIGYQTPWEPHIVDSPAAGGNIRPHKWFTSSNDDKYFMGIVALGHPAEDFCKILERHVPDI